MPTHRRLSIMLPAAALTALAILASTTAARASCAPHSAKQYVDEAQHVFLGRAGALKIKGKRSYQPITVLHVLKGKPGKVFTRVRINVPMPNDRRYKAGEVALFFVYKGEVALCSGNFPLGAQMDRMAAYFKLGRGRATTPDAAAVQRVVKELLLPYLHQRKQIPITFGKLAGKRFSQGKSELFFVKARRKDAIEITVGTRRGRVQLIEGIYHLEGFVFRALLLTGVGKRKGKLEVLHTSGWERKTR